MKNWIEMAIKERKVTFVMALFVLFFGIYAYYFLPKQENPDTSSPAAQIVTPFPGAAAEEVEALLTQKVEEALSNLDGISYMTSYSNPNSSVVLITLDYDVDYEEQWARARTLLEDLKPELPPGVMDFQIDTDLTTSSGAVLSVTAEEGDLEGYAQQLANAIKGVEGVKSATVEGEAQTRYTVTLQSRKMDDVPLTYAQIADLIKAQNTMIPAGDVQGESGRLSVVSERGLKDLESLKALKVFTNPQTGEVVTLADIATVEQEGKKKQLYKEGESEAVLVNVFFEDNENIVLSGDAIKNKIEAFESDHQGVAVSSVVFQPDAVSEATNGFMMNLLQGVGFVVLVVLLGMGLRNAVVVSVSIPLSIAATVAVMSLVGIDLQQMSISALIIALGILVDNSIVISDAIQEKLNQSKPVYSACYQGARESSIPVLTSTLTTVAAFAPLMALPGEAGEFAKSLPQVVIIALIASYLVAMFVTPALASVFFKKKRLPIQVKTSRMRRVFEVLLVNAIKRKKTAFLFIILIVAASVYGAMQLEISLFPYADKDLVYIDVFSEAGSTLATTGTLMDEMRQIIDETDSVDAVYQSVGGSFPKFYLTVGVRPPSEDYGQFILKVDSSQLKSGETLETMAFKLQETLDERLPRGRYSVNLLEINQPGPAVDVRLSGTDRAALDDAAQKIEAYLKQDTRTVRVTSDRVETAPQIEVVYNSKKLKDSQLVLYDVQNNLNIALSGRTVTEIYKGADVYPVVVDSDIQTERGLGYMKLATGATGESIRLADVATLETKEAYQQIKRHNEKPAVFVSTDVMPSASATSLQKDVEAYVDTLGLDGRVSVEYGGDKEIVDRYVKDLFGAAALALIIIYLILLIQFNSFKVPFIILATVPLSVVGSVGLLLLLDMHITFTVGLGVASLIGIVVNNAILLMDYFKQKQHQEASLESLCVTAMNRRFRPIMLSSMTTIIGLVPLALSGSSFFTPMAVALMGGLMVSTLLTLIVIPLIYHTFSKTI